MLTSSQGLKNHLSSVEGGPTVPEGTRGSISLPQLYVHPAPECAISFTHQEIPERRKLLVFVNKQKGETRK